MSARDRRIGWGILGTGEVASLFAEDLRRVEDAAMTAVGSRSREKAERFGERFGIPHRHASYDALVDDPDVDVVYVATPPPTHARVARLAITARKAVLCEKPFTLNAGEARALVSAARASETFLMEAMWTRFLPHIAHVRELLGRGAIGDIRLLQADVGQRITSRPAHRLLAPDLGGGALLDLGVYPLSLFSMLLGDPRAITAVGALGPTGVDTHTTAVLEYTGGARAVSTATLETVTPTVAAISGDAGRLEIESRWYQPSSVDMIDDRGVRRRFSPAVEGRGMQYQAAEVCRCVRQGLRESPVMPLEESVSIMATIDEIRRRIGLRYPAETAPMEDVRSS